MANQFDLGDSFIGSNVIGMPGISSSAAEVMVMEPRSFDEMPKAIQALRERKTIIINLTMMEPDQAQRAVDFVAGGTFAIDGHQERVGESIFLFAPSCVTVTSASTEESASPSVISRDSSLEQPAAPSPAWGRSDALNGKRKAENQENVTKAGKEHKETIQHKNKRSQPNVKGNKVI